MSKSPSSGYSDTFEISQINQELNELLRFTVDTIIDKPWMTKQLPKIKQIVREKITARGAGAIHEHATLLGDVLKNCSHKQVLMPVLEVFLKAGMNLDLNKETHALHFACASALQLFGKYCPESLNIDGKSNSSGEQTPLTTRVAKTTNLEKYLEEIYQLLLMGANPNARDGTWNAPLHVLMAADVADKYMVQVATLLLEAGANPNAPGDQGQTPLGILCSGAHGRGKASTIALLLEHGATPCLEVGQLYKMAWMAIDRGNASLLEKAIELGLKAQMLDDTDDKVKTLHFAAALNEPTKAGMACLKMLLDHGWDPQWKNEGGQTLLEQTGITEPVRAVVQSHLAAKEARAAIDALSEQLRPVRVPAP